MAVPASAQSPRPPGKDRGFSSSSSTSVVTSTTGGCRNHNRGKRVHREIVQPPGRDDRAGPHFQPVVVLLTRLTTSATFAPKASAVFKSPGIISSTEASEGETTTRPR